MPGLVMPVRIDGLELLGEVLGSEPTSKLSASRMPWLTLTNGQRQGT
jgi:hypothetical protein